MKLTLKERWMVWWGLPYLLNRRTNEIHCLKNKNKNCQLNLMSAKNKIYLTTKHALWMLAQGKADGCRWCLSDKNTG